MPNKSKPQPERKIVYRDSDKGRFVPKEYADKHPKTTEKERVRTGK
ncbi:MAG TPA: hypothetical protein VGO50_18385 [Pyrinomonadaceae bacterium]|jgi:hypothetical protein|nr:hypothetical protein [Pyrinomonadaceae bacterium]